MGEMADYTRDLEERQEYGLYPDDDCPTTDEYFLANLIKKYSNSQDYKLSDLADLVKSRVATDLIKDTPRILGILDTFERNRSLSGKQRDVLIKALAYSDQVIYC